MVIVSHDRHLLKTVTDELLIVHQAKVEEFEGDLDDYAVFINQSTALETVPSADQSSKSVSRKEQRQLDAQRRKQLQPLLNALKKSEKQIDELTKKQSELEKQLADPDSYTEENKENLKRYVLTKSELDKKLAVVEAQWMEISEEYENASALIVDF